MKENAGLKIAFTTDNESTRYSTYSIRNETKTNDEAESPMESPIEFYAFKVLPMEFDDERGFEFGQEESSDEEGDYEAVTPGPVGAVNCQEQAGKIVRKIVRACVRVNNRDVKVEEKDVVR